MEYYTWILTFHIMAIISWMAVLFYQPRLYVYHTEHQDKEQFVEVVQIQELKMYKIIGIPAMWASILSGGLMLFLNTYLLALEVEGWIYAKLFFILLLLIYTYSLGYFMKELKKGNYARSGNFFRAYNEIPTILALLIVGYTISKTFSIAFTVITLCLGAFIVYKVYKQKKHQ